jgi:hypothetical protein
MSMTTPFAVLASRHRGCVELAGDTRSSPRGKIMDIIRFIQRSLERVLPRAVLDRFRKSGTPAPARFCLYGHEVFSGNNLCSYGHHAA